MLEPVLKKIVKQIQILLQDERYYQTMAKSNNPCGDGKAAKRIMDWLSK
jgi:UDP-N-acetylglucosamine 2-epimerase